MSPTLLRAYATAARDASVPAGDRRRYAGKAQRERVLASLVAAIRTERRFNGQHLARS